MKLTHLHTLPRDYSYQLPSNGAMKLPVLGTMKVDSERRRVFFYKFCCIVLFNNKGNKVTVLKWEGRKP